MHCILQKLGLSAILAGMRRSTEESLSPAMEFVSETVAEGRVTTDPRVVVRLLDWVAGTTWQTAADRDALETKFLALLHHLDYQQDSLPAKGRFCAVVCPFFVFSPVCFELSLSPEGPHSAKDCQTSVSRKRIVPNSSKQILAIWWQGKMRAE